MRPKTYDKDFSRKKRPKSIILIVHLYIVYLKYSKLVLRNDWILNCRFY